MNSVADFLKRAAERNGFRRDRFEERRMPTDFSGVTIMPFFGDMRSSCVLSSLVLQRFREEVKGSKYFVMASWPGMQGLFPYVDEYWSFGDMAIVKRFYEGSEGLRNKSDFYPTYIRNFNEFFRDVVDGSELMKYYRNGFTPQFFEKFKDTKRFLPFVPSASILGKEINRDMMSKPGYKIFLTPSIFCRIWGNGASNHIRPKKEFWVELCRFMIESGVTPVVWQNFMSWDISDEVGDGAIYLRENDAVRAMSLMRSCSCVLDVFNGLSRFALLARAPFLAIDERTRHRYTSETEIDELLGISIPRQYIFTFSTIVTDGSPGLWRHELFRMILGRFDSFLPYVDRDMLPSTVESNEPLPYGENVHVKKRKRLGTRFIKVQYD